MKSTHLWLLAGALLLTGCSVMPAAVEQRALPDMAFPELVQYADRYRGQMVILGGYVTEVENLMDHTRLVAVQAPLGYRREPKSRDLSQGRLVVIHKGFLDPAVYSEGRKITVAGRVLGSSATDERRLPYPYLRIELDEVYLWPQEQVLPHDYYYRDPWYWHPYPWGWRHPYWW
jgi:outer membrane lipoprotein